MLEGTHGEVDARVNALVNDVERLESVQSARCHEGDLLVVPTEAGWETLAREGKQALIRQLGNLLAPATAAERAERRWRFVRRLPAAGQARRRRPLHPRWRELARTGATWLGEAEVAADLAVLEGHFPGEPVVPGVAQLLWADTVARRLFAGHAATAEIGNLKFARLVVPGVRLRLELVHETRTRSRVAFSFASDAGNHSSGILFAA